MSAISDKYITKKKHQLWQRLAGIVIYLLIPASLALGVQDLNYSGRLTNANGSPMTGPVELSISFYRLQTGGEPIGPALDFGNVELVHGVFTVDLKMNPGDIDTVFSNGADPAYVQVTAAGKTYPRQRLLPVPLALRVPVDNSTVEFNSSGLLGVKSIPMSKVEGLSGILGTSVALKGAAGSTMDGYLSKDDWQRFDAKQDKITTSSTLATASLTTSAQKAISLEPFAPSPGSTGEIRFGELSAHGQNYVGFKAPDAVAANLVWTLPTTLGSSGQVLSTNSGGNLSWISPKLGTVTQIATGPGLVGGPITMSGQISLADTTVIPGYYPRANISVDAQGRITSASQGSDIDLAAEVFGTLPINRGGTGTAVTPTNGQLLIGNGTGYSTATLNAGTGMIVTNSAGGIRIDATADPATKVSKSGDTMTGNLMVDGNVGIGTTAPGYKLQVLGSFLSKGADFELDDAGVNDSTGVRFFSNAGNLYLQNGSGDNIFFRSKTAGTNMTIQNGGNVGVGTVSPAAPLHIRGPGADSSTYNSLRLDNPGNGTAYTPGDTNGILLFWNTIEAAKVAAVLENTSTYPSSLALYTSPGSSGATEKMRITSTGNVGIGTTAPVARLAIAGGQAVSAYYSTASSTIDWNDGNIQNSSAAAGTVTLNSMIDGGVYTLILSNSSGGSYTFSSTGTTFRCKPACPVLVTGGAWTVVTVLKAGSTALLSWGGGYQ